MLARVHDVSRALMRRSVHSSAPTSGVCPLHARITEFALFQYPRSSEASSSVAPAGVACATTSRRSAPLIGAAKVRLGQLCTREQGVAQSLLKIRALKNGLTQIRTVRSSPLRSRSLKSLP